MKPKTVRKVAMRMISMMESLLSGIPGEYSGVYEKQIVFLGVKMA